MNAKLMIRTELPGDYDQVRDLNIAAFGNRNDEAGLVDRIRRSPQFVPQLSIVAELEGAVVGHVLLSKVAIVDGGESHEAIGLAPIAVSPALQKQGIGSRLMEEGLKRCRELGFPLVLLIGHPTYYPRFGFKPARPFGLELRQFEVPDDVFMACELKPGTLGCLKGELKYPETFF